LADPKLCPIEQRSSNGKRPTPNAIHALDIAALIRIFAKLKLVICARPGNRAGIFVVTMDLAM